MIIYIAGKITNDPGYKEKFRQAERHIKTRYPAEYLKCLNIRRKYSPISLDMLCRRRRDYG